MKDTLVNCLYGDQISPEAITLVAKLEESQALAKPETQVKIKNIFPTILYAEHSAPRRLRLTEDMERAGFLVRTAECANDALDLTARCVFDVTILDYELPDMTGAQLAQEIRALDSGAQILLLSTRPHLPAGELIYVDFHAFKDLPLDTLIEIVHSLLESSGWSFQSAAPSPCFPLVCSTASSRLPPSIRHLVWPLEKNIRSLFREPFPRLSSSSNRQVIGRLRR